MSTRQFIDFIFLMDRVVQSCVTVEQLRGARQYGVLLVAEAREERLPFAADLESRFELLLKEKRSELTWRYN
jgi:hypothetical protein